MKKYLFVPAILGLVVSGSLTAQQGGFEMPEMTPEQMKEMMRMAMQPMFDQFDADDDDSLSLDEFKSATDENRDGEYSSEEMLGIPGAEELMGEDGTIEATDEEIDEVFKTAFNDMDADDDDGISFDEMLDSAIEAMEEMVGATNEDSEAEAEAEVEE